MASGLALSTARGGEIYMGSEIRDSLSLLDILYANQFEGESLDPEVVEHTEETFYRGAPPEWLNFDISEQAESDGTGTAFIKRDGYDRLRQQIQTKRKLPGISTVKLFHQPGCGGTTLAMQVLWDLRKTFRCAVLTDSTSDITNVATEVVHLFTAGSRGHQNTVLLLLNDEHIPENLQNSIMEKITEQNIVTYRPVVIFLTCVRKDAVLQSDHVVLRKVLSDTEKQKFKEKKKELSRRYRDRCRQFHGFNIMQTNFSQAYVKQACTVFSTVQRSNKPLKTQLATFLSLLNAYVPGSYLLESQCLDFLQHKDSIHGHLSLEDRMTPFSHLIITFRHDVRSGKKVRMAHPMIAQCCTELMGGAGVTRSDTARNFLNRLCTDEIPPHLLGFVRDMLTKRGMKVDENPKKRINADENKEDQERFSRLILDIQKKECEDQSASVLKVASKIFVQNPFFPQALARFYYIEIKDYNKAERWAKEAKERDPKNSFVADTLGQVYKNQLKTKEFSLKQREILQLAKKAIEAFKDEERLAENEYGADMKEDGITRVSNIFNIRGQFGYLQVCNLLYDRLVSQNETWKRVLTNNVSMGSVLELLGDNKLYRLNGLVSSLRDEVERKCAFFEKYLTYSKPDMRKDDAPYISRDTSECYKKYVGESPPKHLKEKCDDLFQRLKEKLSVTSAGVLSCLDRKYTESDLQEITTWWKEIYSSKDTETSLVNYILAHIMLNNIFSSWAKSPTAFKQITPPSSKNAPELNMLALLSKWPMDSEDTCVFDLSQSIQYMYSSYEHTYKTHFRSRYLRPLFFIGKGQNLNRIVHRRVLENLFLAQKEAVIQDVQDLNVYWGSEKIFHDPMIQKRLLQIKGRIQNYRLYATFGNKETEVEANLRNSLWKPRQVTFYLGFTIRGPVAFGIQTKMAETGLTQDTSDWTELKPEVNRVGDVQTYSLRSGAGHYECSVSTVRWFCKGRVSFKYQFTSWEKHIRRPSCVDYIPAGPLLNIKVTAGKIEEVHLPHWISTDDNPTISDHFAVLHVDTSGHYVEKVSEVTSSHVKLLKPVFSPRGVMIRMKLGLSVKVFYDAFIYKTNKASLTLHVYLLPPDPVVQQAVERQENSHSSRRIQKPSPDKPLRMENNFFLTTDTEISEICPHKLKLTCERRNPNYFEVFIRDANSDFSLKLEGEQKRNKGKETVWTCMIRKDDYQERRSYHEQGQHFVDRHRTDLINRVTDTGTILDELKNRRFISNENYDTVRALKTTQNQMREIFRFLNSAGRAGKDALYEIMRGKKHLRFLISDLEESE